MKGKYGEFARSGAKSQGFSQVIHGKPLDADPLCAVVFKTEMLGCFNKW
jgi:hypothetical protein